MKPINRLVVGISLAILVVAPISMAQVIEEITVTARKKSENLQDVPISVNIITSKMLDRRGIKDLRDVVKMDASLIFDKGFAPDDIRVVVRGIDNGRGRPVVATIIDGADISSEALNTAGASQLISPRLIDIERIEIVKGPQVALYGRTAFAGAISYITKGASETSENKATLDVAGGGFRESRFSFSGPVSDTLGIRFNAMGWSMDGFHTNTVSGEKIGGGEGQSASILFDWNPSEKLSIRTRIDHVDDENEAPAQAFIPYNTLRRVPDVASWCNGGWVHDASCNGYAQALEHVMAWGQQDALYTDYSFQPGWKLGCGGPPYIPSVAAPDPLWNSCYGVNTPGFASSGTAINLESGNLYEGRFDDMEHWALTGGVPGGDDLVITQDINVAHPGNNVGKDMFGSTKKGERLQINLEYDLGIGTFSSITHMADMDVAQQYDIDKQSLVYFNQEWNVFGGTKLYSQEFRLQTENDGPLNMAIGALYWHEDTIQTSNGLSVAGRGDRCKVIVTRDANTGNILEISDFSHGPFTWEGPCGHTDTSIVEFQAAALANRPTNDTIRDTVSKSLYSVIDYEFNERLTMTMEIRWVDERERLTASASQGLADGMPTNTGASSVALCGSHIRCDATGGFVPLEWYPYSGRYPMLSVPVVIGDYTLATGQTGTMPNAWVNANVTAANPTGMGPTTRQEPLTFTVSDNYVTPKIVLRYAVTDDVMVYGSWTESKKPGGFSTIGTGAFGFDPNGDGNPDEVQFKPEIMAVWELGWKSMLLDGQLRVNGAVFFEDYTDKQTNVQKIIGNILGSVTANADGGEALGLEIDFAYAATDQLTISGGYTYLDTEYTDYVSYSRSAGEIARDGTCVRVDDYLGSGDAYCMIDRSGNQFERAPKNAAVINLSYEDQLGDTGATFFVDLNSRYQGKRWIDNSNDAYVQDYWRFDLNAGITKGNWDTVFYVKNLLDDDTVVSAGTGPDIGNSDFRFGMVMTFVQHEVLAYPGGPVVATYSMPDVTGQYGSSDGLVSIVPAPMIRNMWYANMPDPRQIGMRVSYSF